MIRYFCYDCGEYYIDGAEGTFECPLCKGNNVDIASWR